MNYRNILVHLDASERAPARLKLAMELATRFDAYLTALFVVSRREMPSVYVNAGTADYFINQESFRNEQRAELEQRFHSEIVHATVHGAWLDSSEHPNTVVPKTARLADLTIIGQFDPDDPESFVAEQFAENLVLSAGRPVLIVPYAGHFSTVGTRVLLAWDAGREATRALHDALPFLISAEQTAVLTVNALDGEPPATRIPGVDIAEVIARHGANVVTQQIEGVHGASVGEMLLSRAADFGADLIVMGCYGHSRWRELALGGTSRSILQSMTVPVLMSH
ncbi:universal stress protein [Trinickia sp. LjRoot230]|uniref:universal stress protein n=1 Tax=Trinickia sp. LjRoot230 TaxID=3342288 RepID=UPI003ECC5943